MSKETFDLSQAFSDFGSVDGRNVVEGEREERLHGWASGSCLAQKPREKGDCRTRQRPFGKLGYLDAGVMQLKISSNSPVAIAWKLYLPTWWAAEILRLVGQPRPEAVIYSDVII